MGFGIYRREPYRVQIRSDVAFGWRCSLDFENRTGVPEEFCMTYATLFRNFDTEI